MVIALMLLQMAECDPGPDVYYHCYTVVNTSTEVKLHKRIKDGTHNSTRIYLHVYVYSLIISVCCHGYTKQN